MSDDEQPKNDAKAYRYNGAIDLEFLGPYFSVAKTREPDTGIVIRYLDNVPSPSWNVHEGDIMVRAGDREFYVIERKQDEAPTP